LTELEVRAERIKEELAVVLPIYFSSLMAQFFPALKTKIQINGFNIDVAIYT
jgi:hypothetical protein